MTTTRKIRVLNIATSVLLIAVLTLQFTKVIDGFWSTALLVVIAVVTIVGWGLLERRQAAEKMRGGA